MFQNPTDLNSVKKYPLYNDLLNKIYDIRDRFSVMPQISGKSVLGRGIFSISIGNPKSSVLLMGGIKGSHWITSILLLLFCEDLLTAYQGTGKIMGMNIGKVLENRGVILLPCLNPDGFEVALRGLIENQKVKPDSQPPSSTEPSLWDFNANGVSIGLNFDTNWDCANTRNDTLQTNRGKKPFSEPESTCIARLCFENHVKQLITLGLGEKNRVAYNYNELAPPSAKLIAELIVSGSEYSVCKNCESDSINNWFIETFRRPSFSFSINTDPTSLCNSSLLKLYEEIKELLVLSLIL